MQHEMSDYYDEEDLEILNVLKNFSVEKLQQAKISDCGVDRSSVS